MDGLAQGHFSNLIDKCDIHVAREYKDSASDGKLSRAVIRADDYRDIERISLAQTF